MTSYDLELQQRCPLPSGCSVARYINGMREIVQYAINSDEFLVRYDWLENGQKVHVLAEPIPGNVRESQLELQLTIRRAAVLTERGLKA